MDLFIRHLNTPYASAYGRDADVPPARKAPFAHAGRELEPGGVQAGMVPEVEPQSTAADAYRAERAYDKRRNRRRKLASAARVLLAIVAVPLAVALVFLGAYCATFVLNGATPEELMAALADLAARAEESVRALLTEFREVWPW